MKIRWLSILIALILIFSSIICSAEELAHLEKTNNGHPYNPTVSEQYRAEVYGYPHGEFLVDEENGNMVKDGQRGEYQYLGYNRYDHDFPNDKWFREQRHRGNIFDEDYNDVEWIENPAALESWKDINNNPELLEYMTTEEFFDTDHPTMGVKPTGKNIVQLLGENYQNIGIVISPPSKDASGHIKCYYKKPRGSSNVHYNTIIIKPIPHIQCVIRANPDKKNIPEGEISDVRIEIDTNNSLWTLFGEEHHDFTKREYWAGIEDVIESQKVESVDGVYTFNVENVSPGTTIKVWSKVYSQELEKLGYEYAAEATTDIYIGERLPPQPNEYDLDYNLLSRKVKYSLSDTDITAKLILPKGTWVGSAWGSLNVKNETPSLLKDFSVTNNDYVDEYSDTIERNPEVHTTFYRKYFGDNPENRVWLNPANPLIPMTGDGEVSYGGEVSRDYKYNYSCSGCVVIGNEETGFSTTCSGHTGYGTAHANFDSGASNKTVRAFIYNGMPVIPPKLFENNILYNSTYSASKNMYWTSEPYKLDVIRWMYHMDENGNLYNPTDVDGQYQRTFTQQCSAKIEWSIDSSMAQNYERSRKAALRRDYRKEEYDKAVFASDIDFRDVDYPIKSGYYFNPCGSYEFTVETVTYKTTDADTKDHKDLVNAVINSFRYETDLMYINKDKEAVNIQNELLPKEGNNYGRRPASLTAQDPTGVDDIVLLEVFDRSTNGSRYSKTVEELYHSQSITGNTHRYLKEIMEGYWESGTGSSESEYKYREYIKDGQKIYKITERTRVTIRINPYNRNVYTHAHMPDGTRNYINDKRYMVKAWIGDIDLSGINNEYKKLGVLRGLYILDEIKVSVKGSLYDDVTW